MTTDHKAPLPDEVEKALDRLKNYEVRSQDADVETLRAHIAAQDEKIAELQERLEVAHCYVVDNKTCEVEHG